MSRNLRLRLVVSAFAALVTHFVAEPSEAASCLVPRGDIDSSGQTSVVDVQCEVLVNLWEFAGQGGPQPTCLKVSLQQADINCDGNINVSDVQLVVRHALNIPLPTALDIDQNGCVDICELDSDGDGDGDFFDCSPYSPGIGSTKAEVCNGIDDDCDGLVDETAAPTVAASCQNGDACDGQETCAGQPPGLGLMINEIMIDPSAVADAQGEWFELYNPTATQIDINGWRIQDNVGTHIINNQGPLRIPPGRYIVLGRNADPALNGGFNLQYVYTGIELANTTDSVILANPAGVVVDRVDYTAVAFSVQAGRSIALKNPALDNNVGTSWAASTASLIGAAGADKGTPKSANIDVLQVTTCQDGPDLVCNDGIGCTIDACAPATGCTVTPDHAACSDGVGCTTDTCNVATGCVNTTSNAACDDGVGCTIDVCDATQDCINTTNDAACDDGIDCTLDICDDILDCASLEDDGACDDGIGCTLDICDGGAGCVILTDDTACNDGIACTVDECSELTDCSNTPDNAACNDGEACTTDVCAAGQGCTYLSDDAACNDGVDCTLDICDGSNGCASLADDAECDDGVDCTLDICDELAGCQILADDSACDDGIACTLDTCDPAAGCMASGDDLLCDDGDPCTTDSCDPGFGCAHVPVNTPECQQQLEGNQFCAISGTAGSTATCVLRLARFNAQTPAAAALSFDILFDPAAVAPTRFLVDICTGPSGAPPCMTLEVPPSTLATGHSLFPAPGDLGTWPGMGSAFVLHLDDPMLAITDAFMQGGFPQGETAFAKLEVELLTDIAIATPSYLEYADILGSTSDVKPLVGTVVSGTMVTAVAQCGEYPGVCDDGNACTLDTCNAGTGACSYAPATCSDGNACNGTETCNPNTGCVAGAPLACNDGQSCTTDSCDPVAGCVYAPDHAQCGDGVACTDDVCVPSVGCVSTANDANCNDGVACTMDSCSATTGCSNTPSDAACDDGFACTTETCDPLLDCEYVTDDSQCTSDDGNPCTEAACVVGAGCASVVLPASECLPDGALCALSGAAGSTALCPIRVARGTIGTPAAAALQFALAYDGALARADGAQGEICMGPNGGPPCMPMDTPPSTLQTGHTVAPAPSSFAAWTNGGALFLFNLDAPGTSINDAHLAGGAFIGDTHVFDVRFEMLTTVDPGAPLYVTATGIVGSTADVAPLVGSVQAGTIILAAADCTDVVGTCDDGDPCTTDACNGSTGECVYTGITCTDGNACNGLETCIPLLGCQPGPAPQCDDGQGCTTESCDAALGCVYDADDAACDDGVACTDDSCAPFTGCANTASDVACNDGVPCTVDACDPVSGCSNTPSDALCDDGAACTSGTCDVLLGCQFTLDDSGCEDDGNPCTEDACVVGVGCAHTPIASPECLEPGVVCLVSGASGSEVICPLQLARAAEGMPLPTALQVTLSWDAGSAKALSFQDTVCPGGVCVDFDTPPGTLDPSGHTVVPAPANVAAWNGGGSVFFLHTTEPGSALSNAHVMLGSVVGDGEFAALRLELLEDVDPATPLAIYATGIQATTAQVQSMPGEAVGGVMIVALAACTASPSACDDGNPCTTDACNAGSGACEYTTTPCGDGNACNGIESCIPYVGCVMGPPPACDDGTACTADSCDPAMGCVYTPSDAQCDDGIACTMDACATLTGCTNTPMASACDDGVACTEDTCDGATGCANTPSNAACNDGLECTSDTCDAAAGCLYAASDAACDDDDPCTIDSCTVGQGCFHVVSADPACLPDGALCAISGKAGDIVACPLRLARSTQGMPAATAFDLSLELQGTGAEVIGLKDEMCLAPGNCMDLDVPPSPLFPSGHTVVAAPGNPATWGAEGGIIIFHTGDPTAPITPAYRNQGAIQGDAEFARLLIQLTDDVSGYDPVLLVPTKMEGVTAEVSLLLGEVWQGVMLLSSTGCVANPGMCNDGNACTTDSCDPLTSACTYSAAVVCDDGDACNGWEACDPADGTCIPGMAPDCDDGIACTLDTCDSELGCMNEAQNSACPDDGDACTTELCYVPMGGCISAPDVAGDCLPGHAVCAVFGPAGSTASCRIGLARATQASAAATALQFSVTFNNAHLALQGITDEICIGPVCMDVPVPPGVLAPSGHTAALAPANPSAWVGTGSIFVFHTSEADAAITDAYMDGGAIQGDSQMLDVQFTMKQSVSPFAPSYVYSNSILGTSTGLDSLMGSVQGGLLVTAP